MLQPLTGEVGYKSNYPHQIGQTLTQAPLAFYYQIELMVFLNGPFFYLSMADNVIAFRCSSVIYPHLPLSPSHFQKFLSTFSIESELTGNLFGIQREQFSKSIENNYMS